MEGKTSGFTLIEIIVVIGVIALVATVLSSGLLTIFRTNTQSSQSTDTKQNGDQALSSMERMLRAAQSVTSPCDGTDQVNMSFTDRDNNETKLFCAQEGTTTYIASESAKGTSRLTGNTVTLGVDCVQQNIVFSCTRSPNGSQVVSVAFTLSTVGQSPTSYFNPTSAAFKTIITVRNE